jgi:hypothetical protein
MLSPPSEATPGPASGTRRSKLSYLWRPNLAAGYEGILWPYRLRMITGAISVLLVPVALGLIIARLAGASLPSFTFLLFTAVLALSMSATSALRVWMLLSVQQWRGLDGQPARRAERPRRFWGMVGTHVVISIVFLWVAAYLAWTAFGPGT